MGIFLDITLSRVPAGFDFADPLRRLFAWVDAHDSLVEMGEDGELYGCLHPDQSVGTRALLQGYTREETVSYTQGWFGDVRDDPSAWLWPFVETGSDGSMAALWLAPDDVTRIVHLGSGSGSLLTGVLVEDPLDFLRLLAIGYPEICADEEFDEPPAPWNDGDEILNEPFREWVCSTFDTTIPRTAREIVPPYLGDDARDPFAQLVNRLTVPE